MSGYNTEVSESNAFDEDSCDKTFIHKILGEMKNQFNKNEKAVQVLEEDNSNGALVNSEECTKDNLALLQPNNDDLEVKEAEELTKNINSGCDEKKPKEAKPKLLLLFKKPEGESPLKNKLKNCEETRRSPRGKSYSYPMDEKDNSKLKRSARRKSKDCNESVLQSAIARKEKSYNEANKPQRLCRQLKPTQKILENIASAKHEKVKCDISRSPKSEKAKNFIGECNSEGVNSRYKHKLALTKNSRKSKRLRYDSEKDSDSDTSGVENSRTEEKVGRRSQRLNLGKNKDDTLLDSDDSQSLDHKISDSSACGTDISSVSDQLIASRLCLCTENTKLYVAKTNDEVFCAAVDSVEKRLLGCTKLADLNAPMLRCSKRVPYMPLCRVHRNRMLRHNCCPTCGVFCTQGTFTECPSKHQYHRECQICVGDVQCCPHCGASTPDGDITVVMSSPKKPIFLPVQKLQHSTAKMTFNGVALNSLDNDSPILPVEILELLHSVDFEDKCFDFNDLLDSVNEENLEKLAIILGSKKLNLLTKLSNFDDGNILHYSSQNGLLSIVHMLVIAGMELDVYDKEQNTPLMLAVLSKKNDVVRYLIKAGASVNIKGTDGMTPLHLAAKSGNLLACKYILSAVSRVYDFVNRGDDGGWTPLVWACEHGFVDVAKFLIDRGADPCRRDVEHNVALHWAAFSGSENVAQLLLDEGCDVNAVNVHGDTPLHIGARQDCYNCVVVFLARGANVKIINKNNETALDCAPEGGACSSILSLNTHLQYIMAPFSQRQRALLCNDISKGKENNPIQCLNMTDGEPKPTDYVYVTKNCLTSDLFIDVKISSLNYCNCEENCISEDCCCGNISSKCWYDQEGRLLFDFNYLDPPMIFECNDRCCCNVITCINRVVQKGLTQRFQLFKTEQKGWGIKTLNPIQRGSFVCEYIGEIISDMEADNREDDSYLFDLDNKDADCFCIDARYYGNFARFINHSCDPNLVPVKVFIDHQDTRFPRIAFFANRFISAEEELSFDYGVKFWIIKYKLFTCDCKSEDCKYSKDSIHATLDEYNRKMIEASSGS